MPKDYSKIPLDVGYFVLDEGEVTEETLGYTRGGEFNDNYAVRTIEVDGRRMPIKGEKVVESFDPMLTFNYLQMEASTFEKLFAGCSVTDAAGIKTITRSKTIAATAYLTNVTWVGSTKEGKEIKIVLKNALGVGAINLVYADKTEIVIAVSFEGHADGTDDTTAPYELIIDETVA